MKPIYLEMKYFGPHEDSIIDFTKLDESPIFLIGGDTGAGKSTIFDAMTFALFGTTTGDRDAKEMRSQFAPVDEATEVTFYFEQGNLLYKVIRTPEQMLAKKNGKGFTKKGTTAKLATVDQVGGIETDSLASKPSDVGLLIDDILNLNADQFKKIILLPQNDFSEFLKARTDEKEAILKKIFGTQLYSDFTTKLKNKYSEAQSKATDFNTEMDTEIGSSAWTDEERDELHTEAIDQTIPILEKFLTAHQADFKKLQADKEAINKTVAKAEKDSQIAQELHGKFTNLNELKKKFQLQITDKTAEIKIKQDHIAELKWAQPLNETVRDLDNKNTEYQKKQLAKADLDKHLTASKEKFETAQVKVDAFTKKEPKISANQDRIKKLTILIPQVERFESLNKKLGTLNPQVASIKATLQKQIDSADILKDTIKTKTQSQVPVDKLQQDRNTLVSEKDNFVDTLSPLQNKQHNLETEVKQIQDNLTKLQTELTTKTDRYTVAKKDYDEKIVRRQDLMIAQLQKELKDGEACVVCGSTDHSHMVSRGDADEAELKILIDNIDDSQKAAAAAKDSKEETKKRLDETTASLTDKNQELATAKADLTTKYTELTATSELTFDAAFSLPAVKKVFDKQIATIDNQLEAANKLTKEIKQLTDELAELNQKINDDKVKLSSKEADVKSISADLAKLTETIGEENRPSTELTAENSKLEQTIADYQKQLEETKQLAQENKDQFAKYQTKLEDAKQELVAQKQVIDKLATDLTTALQSDDAKTADESVLKTWLAEINQDKLSKIQKDVTNYDKEKEILTSDINQATADVADKTDPDITKIQQILSEQKAQRDALISRVAKTEQAVGITQNSFTKIKKIMQEQAEYAKTLADITSLYNVITGKDGNDSKLKLETYVVQNYLREILNYANDNFIGNLSNNRYSFEIADEGADKRTDHGLDINVYDNETTSYRSTKTLSGGETFIAALSIALSLSEVVQSSANGVQIDALFVDEGFGSLDDETLDEAMKALARIGENRMVGVISHIESMKNSIGQQLIVKKIGDGHSTIELFEK